MTVRRVLPEFRHLRSFSLLGEELHFGRAARRANVTQSGLTQQIQRLEDILGFRLFVRSNRQVTLTPAGESFLVDARFLLDRFEKSISVARSIHKGPPEVRIGYSPICLETPMSRILQTFRERRPDLAITLQEDWSDELEAQFARDEIDLAFMTEWEKDSRRGSLFISRERAVACLPKGHRLCAHDVVSFDDLRGEPLIFPPESHAPRTYRRFVGACRAQGFEPRIVQGAIEVSKVMALAASGVGIGFATECMAGLAPSGVVVRPLGPPVAEHRVVLTWQEPVASEAITAFVAVAREVVAA
jgi:DNA-binding transcriptional LysR family regulator